MAEKKIRSTESKLESAAAETASQRYVLKLYVTGATARSLRAIANIKAICEQYLKGRYDLEVVDIYQRPARLRGEQIVAVPTLDAMAALLPFAALPVCPVLDARKREVYASLYRWDGAGMHRVWEYLAIAPADLARRLEEPVIVLGDAADQIHSPYARRIRPPRRGPSPASVGALGYSRLAIGDTVAPADLVPIYLRPSEAELKRRGAALR